MKCYSRTHISLISRRSIRFKRVSDIEDGFSTDFPCMVPENPADLRGRPTYADPACASPTVLS